MTTIIRKATESDARSVAEVVVRSWREAYRGILSEEGLKSLSVDEREARWRERLGGREKDSSDWTTLVCIDGEKVFGFATYRPCGDPDKERSRVGEVVAIYLLPEYWGEGLGRQLMEEALDCLAASGFSEYSLWVIEGNSRARRFYEQAGFRADGARKSAERLGASVVEVRYVKVRRQG